MSTRGNIFYNRIEKASEPNVPFYNSDTMYFYEHCDAYPSGLGQDLKNILEYQVSGKTTKSLSERLEDYYEDTNFIHGDVDYVYAITETDTEYILQCYKYNMFDKRPDYFKLFLNEEPKETTIFKKQ